MSARTPRAARPTLSHVGPGGEARMVDVSAKVVTAREAVARARVFMAESTVRALRANAGPKGDPIEVARLAGIMAAKRTADLIPLCHPLPLTHVDVRIQRRRDRFDVTAVARTSAQTGVEMEALTAAAVAALTVYDMAKALDKGMTIGDVQLLSKRGGTSGDWIRAGARSGERERGARSEEKVGRVRRTRRRRAL